MDWGMTSPQFICFVCMFPSTRKKINLVWLWGDDATTVLCFLYCLSSVSHKEQNVADLFLDLWGRKRQMNNASTYCTASGAIFGRKWPLSCFAMLTWRLTFIHAFMHSLFEEARSSRPDRNRGPIPRENFVLWNVLWKVLLKVLRPKLKKTHY